MFEAIRSRLARMLKRHSTLPPPRWVDPSIAPEVKAGLDGFLDAAPERFDRLFLRGDPLRAARHEGALLRRLEPLGLVSRWPASWWTPRVRLIRFLGRFIAADLPVHRDVDQVFSPMFEQVYLVRNTTVRPEDEVLEIGTGSGVLSLTAADRARAVTSVDISPRALAFARFNLGLHPPKGTVEFREGSLYDSLEPGRRFDLLLFNPPFEPTPPGESRFLHSDGGEDGLDVARAFLDGAEERLHPGGRVAVVSWSPSSGERSLLVDLMRAALPRHRIVSHVLETWPLAEHLARFAGSPGLGRWQDGLAARGLTHLQCLFLRADPSSVPGVEILRPHEEIDECHAISNRWIG